jgi:hypothetical protein
MGEETCMAMSFSKTRRGREKESQKKTAGVRRFWKDGGVFRGYAKISLPPEALENQK